MDNQENNQINNTQASIPTGADQDINQAPENHPMGIPTGNSVNNSPVENPVSDPPISSPPTGNINPTLPADPPPSENLDKAGSEKLDGNTPVKKDNKLMFLIIGAVLVLAIVLMVMVFSGSLNKSNRPAIPTPQAQRIITPTPSNQDQGIAVSQEPITNQQGVVNTLGDLDKVNPDTAGADLSQNDQDASTFSQ